jgi:hypothetical protein
LQQASDEEQVDALALGLVESLARVHLRKLNPSLAEIASVMTITEDDVRRVLAASDAWLEYVHQARSNADGFYVLPTADGYLTFDQERGCRFDEQRWATLAEARQAYGHRLSESLKRLRKSSVDESRR